jgi:hypothetical protein
MNWSDVLASVLPTVALLGAGLLKTHAKVKQVLVTLEAVLAAATSGKTGQ